MVWLYRLLSSIMIYYTLSSSPEIFFILGCAIIQAPEKLLNLYRWFTRRYERNVSRNCKVCKRTKIIDEFNMHRNKNQIIKILGPNTKGKCVKANGHEKVYSNRKSMYVINSKDLKWIVTKFEKIDSTLECMRECINKTTNKDDNSLYFK